MRLRVLWFGRPGADPCPGLVEEYRRRVGRRWPAEDVPLRPARGGRSGDPARARRLEARVVADRLPAGWRVVLLEEGGRQLSSVELARWLRGVEEEGCPGVAWVVGSDLGLDPSLQERADLLLSLGRLTLPHMLARLVLWEQLFRAADILAGGGYHRGS